ncbi:MAG TPA: carboxypeptidase regulatory-like domain-containing protein [Ignavibacteriaceae bacterium]|nr:carboxypeptidase regulatory-like domain-containing protein [Ignavibacteriaceae bacterium]
MKIKLLPIILTIAFFCIVSVHQTYAQGVTTGSITGIIFDKADNNPLPGANVIAVHVPSGTQYGAATQSSGTYNILNMKIGGPYTVTVTYVGYAKEVKQDVYINLGQQLRLDFALTEEAVTGQEVTVTAEKDVIFNSNRTGAETFINPKDVTLIPSIKRSTRDLIRLDPRSDDNYSFGGRNWLFNNISLDGSYFNNSFGLDDPAPGGQTNAEPVPYDAVEEVQVSIAPFDVREGGFTGAGINTVTKSGTNQFKGSIYSFLRNESFVGNKVSGEDVVANPDLKYNQSGFSIGGPIVQNKLFFFLNGELERRQDPGSNFIARTGTVSGLGISRVDAATMTLIRNRMKDVYGYDTGPFENYVHNTDNEKIILKLDWNINDFNNLTFRFNRLDARRDLPPHPFVLSSGGRGPNENSLPFRNSGYRINNRLNSFALELNSRGENFSNRFFSSYNRFRDYREPFSEPFPTIQINVNGINYTTLGEEPFSIHNILDQDVWQFTDNFSYFLGSHVLTVGSTFEYFSFFNSFNLFRYGLFMVPNQFGGTTFESLDDFFAATDPTDSNFIDFRNRFVNPVASSPYKGENIEVGQLAFYAQDEFLVSPVFSLNYGVRVDLPFYITKPVDNPFSRSLTLLDQNDNPEKVDQSKLPGVQPLFSPRIGFNWDISGNRSTQLRGGTGIFTGRLPFVWIGNVISNPGNNPNLYPNVPKQIVTKDNSILQTSFDLNAMVNDFKWPQVWNSNLAVDHKLPWDLFGTLEFIYGKDINSIYVRNADLVKPVRKLPDGRPYYGGAGNNELNPDGGAGVYVIDNSNEGYNYSLTAQLRKTFDFGLSSFFSYTFLEAKNLMKSTEIASVLWAENPVKGDPNKPELSYSEFGNRHRFLLGGFYRMEWSETWATSFGLFVEVAEGNRFEGAGGNRYSYIYAGDVNGDGSATNDLIYIPKDRNDISLIPYIDANGNTVTVEQQWTALNQFIEQDSYLSKHRGSIADRFGDINPWYSNIDLRLLQDFALYMGGNKHTFQLSIDILNVANLLNSNWGVRQVAKSSATSPLEFNNTFNLETGQPDLKFNMVSKTFTDDPGLKSRYQVQLGLRYLFN